MISIVATGLIILVSFGCFKRFGRFGMFESFDVLEFYKFWMCSGVASTFLRPLTNDIS
jgi:hypothetical protein